MLISLKREVAEKALPERLLLQIKHYKEQDIASQQLCNLSVVFRKRCKSDTLIGITWPQASGKAKPYYNSIHDYVGVSKKRIRVIMRGPLKERATTHNFISIQTP